MNSAQIIKFLELYRDAECLWNTNSEMYKDRNARDDALTKICYEMNIDGFGIREVAQKIKNIRSAYYQELKKVNNSKKSGASVVDIYRPRVRWFSIADSFLRKKSEIDEIIPSLQVQSDTAPSRPEADTCLSHDGSSATRIDIKEEGETFKVPSISLQASSPKKRRLQARCAPPYIGRGAEKLGFTTKKMPPETEFDVWCVSLAKQLNNMETWRALNLQMQIQSLVSKERIAYEKQKSFFSSANVPPCGPFTYQPPVWYYNDNQQASPLAFLLQPAPHVSELQSISRGTTPAQHIAEEDSLDSLTSVCSQSSGSP
ncbi:hypothetical protein AAG570_000194 [Ranatra chinensis]|uniref:MADF domain-containing protein n=1 Tax=Ranatra chinensis TaxID=642074 RepID=A0ABD0Z6T8_9HEMI